MYQAIVFLPLIGAIIAGFFGRWIGDRGAQLVTCSLLVVSALLSIIAFFDVALGHGGARIELFTWFDSGDFAASWALRIDTLTAVMLVVVTGVSSLVHIYSVGYMSHDTSIPRFMSYLSLFTFAMLMLVTADNFVQLFFGWEGVGLASYLLIGFWYKKPSANAAAIKAFLVNRVGDFGFALGIFAVFVVFGSLSFDTVFANAPEFVGRNFLFLGQQVDILTTICILLFIGAMGKSAQLGLHTWLPDAMEGPTPVSALIHAATMVTAGVFMVCRCSPLFELSPTALTFVTFIGATTAFFAATVGVAQNDIKRVIAYSTCSQLGYMFFAAGVSAYGAAIFHLFTHAFFKALLFLGAGSVIHAMSDEQDMRNMGGIRKMIPFTYVMMLVGTLALTGVPFFAGFYSKDMIIESAFAAHTDIGEYAFVLGVAAAFLTAFYSWRLIFMTFHGKPRASEAVIHHVHESPAVMTVPLAILAAGAVGAGYLFYDYFVGHHYEEFWRGSLYLAGENVLEAAHHVPLWVKLLPLVMSVSGFALAWALYIKAPDIPGRLAKMHEPIYKFLLNKWYFDEIYDFLLVRPAKYLGLVLWKKGDGETIDGFGPDGVSAVVLDLSRRARKLQSGYLYHYAFAMLIGVAAIATWFMVMGG
ncbi:MAG: NADH-quinone oxidoreductase subunit L [Alphaproteobacteria bacterium]|nr:MAG: NADH-quinone oxidoreductase subunit L [Alphaproteobacteria bacterium]